jgi:hypothetical protein
MRIRKQDSIQLKDGRRGIVLRKFKTCIEIGLEGEFRTTKDRELVEIILIDKVLETRIDAEKRIREAHKDDWNKIIHGKIFRFN